MAGPHSEVSHSFDAQTSSPGGVEPGKPRALVTRWLLWLGGLLAFGPAAMCFICYVKPFGTNPPPPGVALGAGAAFAAFGCFMIVMGFILRDRPLLAQPPWAMRPQTSATPPWTMHRQPSFPPSGTFANPGVAPPTGRTPRKRNKTTDTLAAVGMVALLVGLGLGFISWQRQTILRRGSPVPQVITTADLGTKGPGNNIHVKLTDFEFGRDYVVKEKGGTWQTVCVPAFPRGKAGDGKSLRVLVRTSRVKDKAQLEEFCRRESVRGVIINSILETGNDTAHLRDAYPGFDADKALVIEEGMTFPNEREITIMYGTAAALLGLAVACCVLLLTGKRQPV